MHCKISIKRHIFFVAFVFIFSIPLFSFSLPILETNKAWFCKVEKEKEHYQNQRKVFLQREKMSLKEQIAQMLLVNPQGKDYFVKINDFVQGAQNNILPGGYLLFSYNITDTKEAIKQFIKSIKKAHEDVSTILPYISIDHEGGYVNRLKKITFPDLPSPEDIVATKNIEEAFLIYEREGKLLKELGIHINFAPIVEVKTEYNESFIGNRSFGSLENVVKYGATQIKAFNSQGILSVLKHFPGNSNEDPHISDCILNVDLNYFDDVLISPFKKLISTKPGGVLISHVKIPIIDSQGACFSEKIVTDILRKKLNFSGLIFSDDIYMAAFTEKKSLDAEVTEEVAALSAAKAIKAGVNVIMSSEKKYLGLVNEISKLAEDDLLLQKKIKESVLLILSEKNKLNLLKIE